MTKSSFLAFLLFGSVATVACSVETTSVPATATKSGTISKSEMGKYCSGVGTSKGAVAGFGGHDDCPSDVCVADARGDDLDTYCSADCTTKNCPAGYVCQDSKFTFDDEDPKNFCVKDPDAASGDDDDDDKKPSSGTISKSDLGEECSGVGTNDGNVAAFDSTTCPGEICVADARGDDLDTYCSADCSKAKCPTGWTCETSKFDKSKFCAKDLE